MKGPAETSRRRAAPPRVPLRKLFRVASVACGIQFGWALQLSLLTPYVQELGIPHAFASVIWLCGPLSGFFVQPLVGHMSDRWTGRFGRRRPFIVAGAALIVLAVLVVGHSADIGWLFGDRNGSKVGAITAFVVGFWLLDVANNMTQGPCRALLADLTGSDHRRTRVANAYFSLFMAVGNVLGFATGSYSGWFKILPFTVTSACEPNCANLKSAFFLDIVFIAITTYISVSAGDELPLNDGYSNVQDQTPEQSSHAQEAFFWELFGTFKYLSRPIWIILLVTALTWIGWFPFLLYDTDWMGREIYGGEPNEGQNYSIGVRMGALGLMLNSVVLGITSLLMEILCRKLGAGVVWGISNIVMSLCFVSMLIISYAVNKIDRVGDNLPADGVVAAALVVFAILGIPLAITYSVPYALISSRIESLGLGQGLSMGVLNLAIVIPQIVVSIGSGPWDQLFGGGNSPALAVAAAAAFVSGLIAILAIPRSRTIKSRGHQ
ncbi:sucrose transport protein SUC4 [Actinidia eriantha]|uniref:sucrose transport protein SUC4 n=1 Tax=Actinidia eriantha TaxID=165200 RepID=UPI0025834ECE|nr:sucrose transport protein SUC4 [Actinidia eriantha]XP_057469896.1 sucrose transport protein SUC4 [Actinidia eriantha]XP_057469897.1 sucrose transport protein SUC4 [Actinidia eriantha]XP_057469898.1 sucrose transport protein SUC4 [Actinidia eriantha]